MTYHAFISYSHAADGKLAPALQSGLQRLAKPWFRLPIIKVFRDQTSLSATPGLWSEIERNLDQSQHFILMASETAAGSVWVEKEVAWWLAHRPPGKLLIVVTDGVIAWDAESSDFDWSRTSCVPGCLAGRFEEEPLYVDMRWAKDRDNLSLRHSQFRAVVLDLAAPLHGMPKDTLDSEDIRQNRRLRAAAWSAGGVIVALAIAAGIAAYVADLNAKRAISNAITALSRQYAVEAQLNVRDGRLRDGIVAALRAFRTEDTTEARGALFEAVQAAWDYDAILRGHAGPIAAIAFRNEGRELLSWSTDNVLVAWDLATRRPSGPILRRERFEVTRAAFSPDGRLLATGTKDGKVILWDAGSLTPKDELPPGDRGEVTALSFDADASRVAVGYFNGDVLLWGLPGASAAKIQLKGDDQLAHDALVSDLAFSHDGRYLAAANANPSASVAVWELPSGDLAARLSPSTSFWVNSSVAFIESSEYGDARSDLAIGTSEGTVQIYRETQDSRQRFVPGQTVRPHQSGVGKMASAAGVVATGGADGLISVNRALQAPVVPASWSRAQVTAVALSPGARQLAVGAADGTVAILSGARLERPRSLDAIAQAISSLERSPAGRWLLVRESGLAEGVVPAPSVSLLDTASGHLLFERRPGTATFSRDGQFLLVASDTLSGIWHLGADPPVLHPLPYDRPHQVWLAPSGAQLIVKEPPPAAALRVWSLAADHAPISGPAIGSKDAYVRGFSPDGNRVLVGEPQLMRIFHLAPARELGPAIPLPPLPDEDDKRHIEWSPDGRWLVVGIRRRALTLYSVSDVEETNRVRLTDLSSPVFSPDGRWLAYQAGDGSGRLWDLLAGKEALATEKGTVDWTFSRDGRRLAVSSGSGLRVLDLSATAASAQSVPLTKTSRFALSPDGRWLLAEKESGQAGAVLYDLDKEGFREVPLPGFLARRPAFSADGQWVGLVGREQQVLLWSLAEARVRAGLRGHGNVPVDLQFSADGRLLASVDVDGSLVLWDAVGARRLSEPLIGPGNSEDAIYRVDFDSNGMWLQTTSGSIPVHPDVWIAELCRRFDPPVSEHDWSSAFPGVTYPLACRDVRGADRASIAK